MYKHLDAAQQLENQQSSSLKLSSSEQHLLSPSQQHHIQSISPQQQSPGPRFRSVHSSMGLHNVPSILQRGNRPQSNQLLLEYGSQMDHQQDQVILINKNYF